MCTRADSLAAGASFPGIRIIARVDADPGTSLLLAARVSTAGDVVASNDQAQVAVSAGASAASCTAGGGHVLVQPATLAAGVRSTVRGRVVAADGRVVADEGVRVAGAGERTLRNAVAASAEGYAFPTDLDRDPPVDGLAPPTQADLLWQAVDGGWPDGRFEAELVAQSERRSRRD
jgi:hypothetical protein